MGRTEHAVRTLPSPPHYCCWRVLHLSRGPALVQQLPFAGMGGGVGGGDGNLKAAFYPILGPLLPWDYLPCLLPRRRSFSDPTPPLNSPCIFFLFLYVNFCLGHQLYLLFLICKWLGFLWFSDISHVLTRQIVIALLFIIIIYGWRRQCSCSSTVRVISN